MSGRWGGGAAGSGGLLGPFWTGWASFGGFWAAWAKTLTLGAAGWLSWAGKVVWIGWADWVVWACWSGWIGCCVWGWAGKSWTVATPSAALFVKILAEGFGFWIPLLPCCWLAWLGRLVVAVANMFLGWVGPLAPPVVDASLVDPFDCPAGLANKLLVGLLNRAAFGVGGKGFCWVGSM